MRSATEPQGGVSKSQDYEIRGLTLGLKAAVAEVMAEHRKTRRPLAVWHNGKAVLMSPDKAVAVARESHAVYGTRRK